MRPILSSAVVLAATLVPLAAHAAIPFFGPIIPADSSQCAAGFALLIVVINRLISFFITLAIVFVAPLMIAYAGFLFVVNPVNASGRETAKHVLWNTIIGIALALGSWLIVDAVMAVLYNPSAVGSTWSSIVTGGDSCIELAGSLAQVAPGAPVTTAPYAADEQSIRARLIADNIRINHDPCPTDSNGQGCTNVAGMQADTVQQIINLADACGGSPGLNGCGVQVTGGTEPGHAPPSAANNNHAHGNGYKVDLSLTPQLNAYLQQFTLTGQRGGDSGGPIRQDTCGNQYVQESNHWDITVVQACGTKATTVASGGDVQCPASQGTEGTLSSGTSVAVRPPSGVITYYQIPAPLPGEAGVRYEQSESPSTIPGGIHTELSVSQCKGVIDSSVPDCYRSTDYTTDNRLDIYEKPANGWNSQAQFQGRGRWAPEGQGPWYLNVRYTYPSCPFADGLCGFVAQWLSAAYKADTTTAPSGGDCPAGFTPPSNMITNVTFPGEGVWWAQKQQSGQVISIPLPAVDTHSKQVAFGENVAANTPSPVTVELTISKCRGYIDTDPINPNNAHPNGNFCNLRSQNGTINDMTWFGKPYSTINSAAAAGQQGYCWAPESDGQWYLNARWEYTNCKYGAATCGFSIQQNPGPY